MRSSMRSLRRFYKKDFFSKHPHIVYILGCFNINCLFFARLKTSYVPMHSHAFSKRTFFRGRFCIKLYLNQKKKSQEIKSKNCRTLIPKTLYFKDFFLQDFQCQNLGLYFRQLFFQITFFLSATVYIITMYSFVSVHNYNVQLYSVHNSMYSCTVCILQCTAVAVYKTTRIY